MTHHPYLDQYDSLLVDLDGTVFEGGRPIDGAEEGLEAHAQRKKVMYVTNNASRAPEQVADFLTGMGFPTEPQFVLTSAMAAIDLALDDVQQRGISEPKAYVIGADSFRELAKKAGFGVVDNADDQPDVVLHGHSPHNNWQVLSEGALAIRRGAAYIASNLDTTLPSERGLLVGNGSMVAAVVSATGVRPKSAGKPGPAMFYNAQERLGSFKPLAVGDRLDTDIAGGNAAGVDTLCVVTGVSGHYALLQAPVEHRPTLIAGNLRDHLEGWTAEQSSTPDGRHVVTVHSGERAGDLADTPADPAGVEAAEAVAAAAPFAWALLDSDAAWEDITFEAADVDAQRAINAWR